MSSNDDHPLGPGFSLSEAAHLQIIEGNPLDDEDLAMLGMFEREAWSDEECLSYMRARLLERLSIAAAE